MASTSASERDFKNNHRDSRGAPRCALTFLCVSVVILLFCVVSASAQFQGKRVAGVKAEFEGAAAGAEQAELLDIISIAAGEEFSAVKVREAILKLYRSGRASNVRVEAQATEQGVQLNFVLTRQLRVDRVTFSGTPVFAESELRPRVTGLDAGAKLSQPMIRRAAESLVRFYQDAGYFQVAITPTSIPDPAQGRATINFEIAPGVQALVGNFELTGALKLDREEALAAFKTQPGNFFTQAQLQADLDRLRKLHGDSGYLNVRLGVPEIGYNSESNTVNVRVEADSGPLVEVSVVGYEIDGKRLRLALPIYEQGGVDDFTIEESRRKLLELLQRDGYFFADISANVQTEGETISITYTIERGQRYRVADIRLAGTNEFGIEEILLELKSRKAAFLGRGLTSQELLAADSEKIAARLRDRGYANAAVVERRLGFARGNQQNLIITFVVEEGPRLMVDEVTFEGNQIFDDDKLRLRLPERKLPYYSQTRLNEDIDALRSLYGSQGFAEVKVDAEVVKIRETGVRVRFRIEEGDQVVINRVVVNNRGRSGEQAIRKYLNFQEGDLLNPEALSKSEQQLYATGAFKTVAIHSEFINRNSDGRALHNVFVETVESSHYTLIYGSGYQSEEGPRGLFQISDANFLGRLQTATFTVRASRREQLGQVSYQFPRPFGLPVNPLAVFFYRRRQDVSFNSRRFTAQLQIERQLNDTSELLFRYTYEDVRVFDRKITDKITDRNEQPIRLGRISGTFISDTRDNIFDATSGRFISVDLSLANKVFGSERDFTRFFANTQNYWVVSRKPRFIYANNIQLGLAHTFDDRARLPLSERFFAGGANTLRGFGFEKAGPRNAGGQSVGGNALIVLNSEMRFPINNRFGGAIFHDTGNVFRTVSDFRFKDFSNTVGGGLRIQTSLGPLRFDVGYLLNPRVPERRIQFHFNFGQAF